MLPSATSPLRDTKLTFCATLPQQYRWFEREDNDVLPLAATVCTHIKLNSALAPDPDPFPDPQQPARPLADFADGHRQTPARRQPHNAPSLHTAWTIQSTSSLELTRRQLGSKCWSHRLDHWSFCRMGDGRSITGPCVAWATAGAGATGSITGACAAWATAGAGATGSITGASVAWATAGAGAGGSITGAGVAWATAGAGAGGSITGPCVAWATTGAQATGSITGAGVAWATAFAGAGGSITRACVAWATAGAGATSCVSFAKCQCPLPRNTLSTNRLEKVRSAQTRTKAVSIHSCGTREASIGDRDASTSEVFNS